MTPTKRVVPLDAAEHQEVQQMLPWLLTGRLEGAELQRAKSHLATCARCQADLDFERGLQARYAHLDSHADAERSLAALKRRLDAPVAHAPARALWLSIREAAARARRTWLGVGTGWRATVIAQAAAIAALLGVLLVPPGGSPDSYRVLATPGHATPATAVIRFRPEASDREMRLALHDSGARIVDGPTVSGAWLLDLPSAGRAAALERLRANPSVLLAESLE